MLVHLNKKSEKKNRVIILGAKSFISKAVQFILKQKKIPYIPLSKKNFDLRKKSTLAKLKKKIKISDTLIFISAEAPVKNKKMFINNLVMCTTVCKLIKKKPVSHLIYISSDAVYKDSNKPLNEDSITQPNSLHGLMHITRETMLKNSFKGPLCILRPTLIYGKNDPHNGYGPNRFFRQSKSGNNILLFGKGEELRDHVWVGDVARIIVKVVLKKSYGVLNIATGKVISFSKIAKQIIKAYKTRSKIKYIKRTGPMPHNGYRAFNIKNTKKAFNNFNFFEFAKDFKKVIDR